VERGLYQGNFEEGESRKVWEVQKATLNEQVLLKDPRSVLLSLRIGAVAKWVQEEAEIEDFKEDHMWTSSKCVDQKSQESSNLESIGYESSITISQVIGFLENNHAWAKTKECSLQNYFQWEKCQEKVASILKFTDLLEISFIEELNWPFPRQSAFLDQCEALFLTMAKPSIKESRFENVGPYLVSISFARAL
jgi:hypothetical protein